MGRLDHEKIKVVWNRLEKAKIFNIGELASLLTCSVPNARLKLKQWQAYTSYNQNGKYYALPQVPRFDDHGLWRYKNAAFSRHGNLKKTVIHLVSVRLPGFPENSSVRFLAFHPSHFCIIFDSVRGSTVKNTMVFLSIFQMSKRCTTSSYRKELPWPVNLP